MLRERGQRRAARAAGAAASDQRAPRSGARGASGAAGCGEVLTLPPRPPVRSWQRVAQLPALARRWFCRAAPGGAAWQRASQPHRWLFTCAANLTTGAVARPCGTCPSARPWLPAAAASFCACWQAAWEPRDATQPMFSQGVRGPFKRPAVRVSMCVGSLRQCMALPCCRSAPGSTACCGAAPGVLEGIWAHCLVVLALRVQVRCCGVAWAPCRGRLPERQWPAGEAARVKKQMRQCMHGAVCSLVTSLVVASSGTVSSFCTDHGSSTM